MKRIPAFFLIFCLMFSFYGCNNENTGCERLTKDEITALREEYPIRGKKLHPLVEIAETDFDDILKKAEAFVFGEITGEAIYTENIYGEFYEFPFTVISDSEGKYKKGDTFTLYANIYFEEYNPAFSKGMKAIVPITALKSNPSKKAYLVTGCYYVTPEGFALSAFDEEKLSDKSLSGLKAEKVLEIIKELR